MASDMVDKFRRRARSLRFQGYLILIVIVLLLFSGAWIFFNAGEITRSDVKSGQSIPTTKDITKRLKEIDAEIEKLSEKPKNLVDYEIKGVKLRDKTHLIQYEMEKIGKNINVLIDKPISAGRIGNIPGEVDVFETVGIKSPDGVSGVGEQFNSIWLEEPFIKSNNYLEVLKLLTDTPEWKVQYVKLADEFSAVVAEAKKLKEDNANLARSYKSSLNSQKMTELRNERVELEDGYSIVKERELSRKFGDKAEEVSSVANISAAFLIQTTMYRTKNYYTLNRFC